MKYTKYFSLPLLLAAMYSCEKKDIKGEEINVQKVSVALQSNNGMLMVPVADTGYVKEAFTVDIPLTVKLSDAAPSIFDIGVSVNNDTITNLIAQGALENAVLLQPEDYSLPYRITVPFGSENAFFKLKVNLGTFEKYYGQRLALAVELKDPTKNNSLEEGKKTVIVQINTTAIVPVDQIHYVYFTDFGKRIDVPVEKPKNYVVGNGIVQVPLSVSYTSSAGKSFYLKVTPNLDTVPKLIASGALPNTVALTGGGFALPDSITFRDFNNTLSFPVNVNLANFTANPGKKVALAVDLVQPSMYKIDSARRTIVVLVDADGLKYNPYLGVPFLLPASIGASGSITIKAADFDLGGEGWGYHDNDPNNQPGTYRPNEGVDIEGNGNNIGFTGGGEWMKYTVEAPADGEWDFAIGIASPNNDQKMHVEVDDENQTGSIAIPNTGDWQKYTYVHTTIKMKAGRHLVKFVFETGGANLKDYVLYRKK